MMQLPLVSFAAVEYGDASLEIRRYAAAEFGSGGVSWLLSQARETFREEKPKRSTLREWLCSLIPSCQRRAHPA